jgi:hypothetical protein
MSSEHEGARNSSPAPWPFEVRFPLDGYLPDVSRESQQVTQPARKVDVWAEVDVAVLGGGPAGVCAAAAAARQGASVLLVERYGHFGGTATAANVNIWHSLYATDAQTRVVGGIPEEIIRRLQQRDACYNQAKDGETGPWVICCETAKLVFDDVVLGSGAKVLLHTWVADVLTEGRCIEAVLVENKSGRGAIRAKRYIDCTGDADLVRRAGLPTQLGNAEGGCQPPSLCFRVAGSEPDAMPLGNVQAELHRIPMDYNGQGYPTFLWGSRGVWDKSERMLAGVRVPWINCSDARDLTRAEIEGRYQMRWVLKHLKRMPGWSEARLLDIASQIGLRESHRILADHQLQRMEVLHGVRFPDAVLQGTYPVDIHNPAGPGITFEYLDGQVHHISGDRKREKWRWDGEPADAPLRTTLCYQVPYRSLIPRELDNVLAAGRCIGAHHDAAGAIRVMINAMQLGQAAGIAAALTADRPNVRDLEPALLRRTLCGMGMPLLEDAEARA